MNIDKALDPPLNRFNQVKNYYNSTVSNGKKAWTNTWEYGGKAAGFGRTALSVAGTALMNTPTYAKTGHDWMEKQPLYQRNVTPLKRFDHIVLGGSLVLTALITLIGIKTLGIAILPIIVWLGMMCILGASTLARHRLNMHFDKLACTELFKIYERIDNTTFIRKDNADIQSHITTFSKPEFNHRKEKWETLKKEYNSFLKKANKHSFEDSQTIVLTKLKNFSDNLDNRKSNEKNLINTVQNLIIEIEKEQDKLNVNKIAELVNVISFFKKDFFDGFDIRELLLEPPSIKAAKGHFNTIVANIIKELGGYKHFDHLACKELVEIQKRIVNIPFTEKDESNIQNRMTKLEKPEFNHRKEKWEILKKEYNSFLNIANQPSFKNTQSIALNKLNVILKTLNKNKSDDKLISDVTSLFAEIEKKKGQLDANKIADLISTISSHNENILGDIDINDSLLKPHSIKAAKGHFNAIVANIIIDLGGEPYVHNVIDGEKKEGKVEEIEEEEEDNNINNSNSNSNFNNIDNNINNNNNNNNNNNINNYGFKIEEVMEEET